MQDNFLVQEDEEEFMTLLTQPESKAEARKLIDHVIENTGSEMQMNEQVAASILDKILQKGLIIPDKQKRIFFTSWMLIAATALFFLAAAAVYWKLDNKDETKAQGEAKNKKYTPIMPGGNRAVLQTSDGSIIIPDSMQNGTVITKGSTKIIKQDGLLIYNISALAKQGVPAVSNTLSTPPGGQYQVVLSDGSKVWLNAASSLHFPSAFTGSQREVQLTGEAYFEVAKNKEKPFLVKIGDIEVKVLGTHFNINAYPDENAIKTSLLEGSVKITNGKVSGLLKPGEQAVLNNKREKVEITKVNLDKVMAWKNGLFQFEGADVAAIMREISRWYNVEIVYEGKVPMRQFEGKISRNAQLSEVLRILELSNVKFTGIGNKIIVQ